MKKIGKFLLENIAGVAAAVAFAVVVWAFTKFNIYILIGGFVVAYFVIGWLVEFLMMTFSKAVVKKAPEEETVKPDLRSGLKYAAARRVDIVTDFEGLEDGGNGVKEPEIDAKPDKSEKKKAGKTRKEEPEAVKEQAPESAEESSAEPEEATEKTEETPEGEETSPETEETPEPAEEVPEDEPYEIPDEDVPDDFGVEEEPEDTTGELKPETEE
jgi:cell division protein FtsN